MVSAHPIDLKTGAQTGPVQKFPDLQWDNMVKNFKHNLAWKRVTEDVTHKQKPFVDLIGKKPKKDKPTQ